MKTESLHIGLKVRHPAYGIGIVKNITEHACDIQFDDGRRTIEPLMSGLEPAEPQIALSALEMPLNQLLEQVIQRTISAVGLEKPDTIIDGLGARWHGGRMVLHPADPTLQTKEVPMEVFFHKIVMMRNNFRVLEQKINANPKLTDGEKLELQQYITRCYGSMTTFNLLFRSKEDQFTGN